MRTALGWFLMALLVGLIVGLSEHPLVAPLIAGLAAAASALVSLIPKPDGKANQRPSRSWMIPTATGAILGVVFGITLRINDVLRFRSDDLRVQYREQGFSEDQVDSIMNRLADTGKKPDHGLGKPIEPTGLMGMEGPTPGPLPVPQKPTERPAPEGFEAVSKWNRFDVTQRQLSVPELVAYYRSHGSRNEKKLLSALDMRSFDDAQMLYILQSVRKAVAD